MNVLFDINHPAQVHLFRHAIAELEERGHETLVTSREKEMTTRLLDAFGIDHVVLTERGEGVSGLVGEMLRREFKLLRVAQPFGPDAIISRNNPPAVHVANLLGARSVIVEDTDLSTKLDSALVRRAYASVTYPLVDITACPRSLDVPVPRERRRDVDFQELAYLHPNRFDPDPSVLRRADVSPDDPYFVLRLAGWDAFHDVGHSGLSAAAVDELVSLLSEHGEVYVSSEAELPTDVDVQPIPVEPHQVHHLLAYADAYIGDSGTMSTEAALLGTPAVRVNTLAREDDESVFVELEQEYELLHSFVDEDEAITHVSDLVSDPTTGDAWGRRRKEMLSDKQDVTTELVDILLDR